MQTSCGPLAPAVALALLLIAAGCGSPEHRAEVHTRRANAYLDEGRAGDAIIELRSALRMTPRNPEAHWGLARGYLLAGYLREAEFHLNEAYVIDPSNDESALQLAGLLIDMNPKRADSLIAEVLERSPENERAYVTRAERRLASRDASGALADANRAIQLAPGDPAGYRELARIYDAQIRSREAAGRPPSKALLGRYRSNWETLLRLTEDDPHEALLGLAMSFSLQQAPPATTAVAFQKALDAALELGVVDFTRKAASATIQAASHIRDIALHERALEILVEVDPWNVDAWIALAELRERTSGSTADLFDELLEQRPKDPEAHIAYARYLNSQQGLDAALAHLDAKLEEKIDPPQLLAAIGELQLASRQLDAVDATIERMRKRHSRDWRTNFLIAQRDAAAGDFTRAAESLRALAKRYQEPEILNMLGRVELVLRRFDAALQAVQRSLSDSAGNDFEARRLLGHIQHDSGDCSSAVKTLVYLAEYSALGVDDEIRLARCLYSSGNERAGREIFEGIVRRPRPPAIAVTEYARHESKNPEQRAAVRQALLAAERLHPTNNQIATRIAELEFEDGNYRVATGRLTTALLRDPMSIEMRLLRARARGKLRKYRGAIEDTQLALLKDEDLSSGAAQLLVELTLAGGQLEGTIANIERMIAEGAAQKGVYVVLGQLHMVAGNSEAARNAFSAVLELDPSLTVVKNDLAYLLAKEGLELDRALTLAKEAALEFRDSPSLIDTLGYVYLRMGRPKAALRQFRTAASLLDEPGAELQYHLGLAFEALGQTDLALRAFVRAIKIDPRFIDSPDARARIRALRPDAAS